MNSPLVRIVSTLAVLGALAGCVIVEPSPYVQGSQVTYNRSWNAAIDAMKDQGITIAMADAAGGRIEGRRGGIKVVARVTTQADGKVRVEFHATGALSEDPGLPDRISRSYEARMGR